MSNKRSMSLTVSQLPLTTSREVKNMAALTGSSRRHSMFSLESRQNVIGGANRRDRTRKKKDGTPDKSTTPSQEPDENSSSSKNVIWNEEIEKLQIKAEDLPKLWPPQPPTTEQTFVRVSVQKRKVAKMDKSKSKVVTIAKPAPPDAPVEPLIYSGFAGPRCNEAGEVIPYSILGTYEDFHKEASQRGIMPQEMPLPQGDLERAETPSLKYEKKKKQKSQPNPDSNALRNWYYRMMERKKQQGYISKLLQKAPEDLVMNQADDYYAGQKLKYLIDRTIPKVDYGKGYRVGSEFWYQQEQFGDDQTGLHMTLTQTQRGYPPPIEHVGLSKIVKEEKGCQWVGKQNVHTNYRWHKSEFLDKRKKELQLFIDEIDPWRPDFDSLQIIGSSRPDQTTLDVEKNNDVEHSSSLESFVDESVMLSNFGDFGESESEDGRRIRTNGSAGEKINEPVFGPSLLFGGQRARWAGDNLQAKDKVGIENIVNFEAFTGDRITSYLEFINDGTTSIFYDWKKMSKENSFGLVQNVAQRFYFNNISGVILPGDTLKFPFVFKSTNAGVYSEQWKFETKPVLCCGAALVVTLRGVALQRDKFKTQREELEKELFHKQAKQVISDLLDELVNGIRTPEPCHSPIDAYITEEEIFSRNNPGLKYNHQLVAQVKGIYGQLFDEDVQAENVWSLSIEDLQDSILLLDDEEEEKREMLLHQMNSFVGKLTYLPFKPVEQNLNLFGRQILGEAIDRIVGQSLLLRHVLGLPDSESVSPTKETVTTPSLSVTEQGLDDLNASKSGENRKGVKVTDGKNKVDMTKDKSRGSAKDVRSTKAPQPVKSDPKGKVTPALTSRKASASVKSLGSTPVQGSTPADKLSIDGAGSRLASPETSVSVLLNEAELANAETLYKESFTLQVYDILGDMADRMDSIFLSLKEAWRY